MGNYKINKVIYGILNKSTGKWYIGKDNYFPNRTYVHKALLNSGKHYNIYLQNAWNKYGPQNFEFQIIKQLDKDTSQLEFNKSEQYHISLYNSYTNGYNLTIGGDGSFGVPCSNSKKLKISIANKSKVRTKEWIDNIKKGVQFRRKPVYQYSLENTLVKVWSSPQDIAIHFNKSKGWAKLLARTNKKYNGFIWSYINNKNQQK